MFTTAAQLLDLTDSMIYSMCLVLQAMYFADHGYWPEKLVLVLRDGRKIIGVLRSWDQFGRFSTGCNLNNEAETII